MQPKEHGEHFKFKMSEAKYKGVLIELMSHLNNVTYTREHQFSRDELSTLTPSDLMSWMNKKVYGVEDPPLDARPTVRAGTIGFWKKSLSYFMPNRLMQWNEISNVGNLTKSAEVNDLIKRVTKKEARKEGAASHRRRPMKIEEYNSILEILKESRQSTEKYGIPALMNYQFHLIARIDDTTQVSLENIQKHDRFDFCLKTKLNWSKNVTDERDAPWQAIIGSLDINFCVLISTSLWLEIFFETYPNAEHSPYLFGFSTDNDIPKGGLKSKLMVQKVYRRLFQEMQDMFSFEKGPLGSHSIRKFAATHVRACGITKDEKDHRGRWKGRKRISDCYDDVELPWIDAKVANVLCIGGACKYKIHEDSGIRDAFILEHVVPGMASRVPKDVCIILGTALLWFVFSDNDNAVPNAIAQRIKLAYANYCSDSFGENNPVKRIPIIITGHEGQVYMDELVATEDGGVGNDIAGGNVADRPLRDQQLAIYSQLRMMNENINTLRDKYEEGTTLNYRRFQVLNKSIQRVSMLAYSGMNATHPPQPNNERNVRQNATLSSAPRTLHTLWEEYTTGLGVAKAAKDFTSMERGAVKHKYTRRKVFWDSISRMINSGLSADVAIDQIYVAYGKRNPVSKILKDMAKDRRDGRIPHSLRI